METTETGTTGPDNYSLITGGTVFDGFPTRAEAERYAALMLPFRRYRIVHTSSAAPQYPTVLG